MPCRAIPRSLWRPPRRLPALRHFSQGGPLERAAAWAAVAHNALVREKVTQLAKTTESPMACRGGVALSLQTTPRMSPPLRLPGSRTRLGAVLPEPPCSLQAELKGAHTPNCAGPTAAGSLILLLRLVAVGVPRPLPLSVCWC